MARFKIILHKILKYTFRFIAILVVSIGLWLLCAWLLPKIKVNKNRLVVQKGIGIFVRSNGVHTDFILPSKNQLADFHKIFVPETFEEVDTTFEYVAFGWGDKGFYLETPTWADLKASTALKAAFWLSETAMHVTYYKYPPRENEKCKKLVLSEEEYNKLVSYIKNSFDVLNGNNILINHPGYSRTDNFYEANGTYNLFKTCNEWTGDGLEECGVTIGIWTPLQGGIIEEL